MFSLVDSQGIIICAVSIVEIGHICHHLYVDTITCTRDIKFRSVVALAEKDRGNVCSSRSWKVLDAYLMTVCQPHSHDTKYTKHDDLNQYMALNLDTGHIARLAAGGATQR